MEQNLEEVNVQNEETTDQVSCLPEPEISDPKPDTVMEGDNQPPGSVIPEIGTPEANSNPFQYQPTEDEQTKLLAKLKTRGHVVREILTTEKDFVEDMKILVEEFLNPLRETGIISENESWMLFGPIEDIIKVNQEMLKRLEERKEKTENEGKNVDAMVLGDIFISMADALQTYKLYCSNQKVAFEFLQDVKAGNSEFVEFLDKCMQNPRCRCMDLMSWLIKPLQRLCKYPLLLREMMAHTPEDSEDTLFLKEAFEKINFTVNFVNSEAKKAEEEVDNEKKLLAHIESMIQNEGVDLTAKAGRKLIKTGGTERLDGKKFHKRHQMSAFLFSDLFVLTYLNVNVKKPKHNNIKILIRNLQYADLNDETAGPNCIELQDLESDEKIVLSFSSLEIKEEWASVIKGLVQDYQKQRALRQLIGATPSPTGPDEKKKMGRRKSAGVALLPLHRMTVERDSSDEIQMSVRSGGTLKKAATVKSIPDSHRDPPVVEPKPRKPLLRSLSYKPPSKTEEDKDKEKTKVETRRSLARTRSISTRDKKTKDKILQSGSSEKLDPYLSPRTEEDGVVDDATSPSPSKLSPRIEVTEPSEIKVVKISSGKLQLNLGTVDSSESTSPVPSPGSTTEKKSHPLTRSLSAVPEKKRRDSSKSEKTKDEKIEKAISPRFHRRISERSTKTKDDRIKNSLSGSSKEKIEVPEKQEKKVVMLVMDKIEQPTDSTDASDSNRFKLVKRSTLSRHSVKESLHDIKKMFDDPKKDVFIGGDVTQKNLEKFNQKISSLDNTKRLIREIVNHENDFIRDCDTILEVFGVPLDYAGSISAGDLWVLIGNMIPIRSFSETAIQQLTSPDLSIGSFFFNLVQNITIFLDYCSTRSLAYTLHGYLTECHPSYAKFVKKCEQNPCFRNRSLWEWLLLPVQHVYQYLGFVQASLKFEWTDEQKKLLQLSLNGIMVFIHELQKKAQETQEKYEEQLLQLTKIDKSIDWNLSQKIRLRKPGREILKQGYCTKTTNQDSNNTPDHHKEESKDEKKDKEKDEKKDKEKDKEEKKDKKEEKKDKEKDKEKDKDKDEKKDKEKEKDEKKREKKQLQIVLCNDLLMLLHHESKKMVLVDLILSSKITHVERLQEPLHDHIRIKYQSKANGQRLRHEVCLKFERDAEVWLGMLSTSRHYDNQRKFNRNLVLSTKRQSRPMSYSWSIEVKRASAEEVANQRNVQKNEKKQRRAINFQQVSELFAQSEGNLSTFLSPPEQTTPVDSGNCSEHSQDTTSPEPPQVMEEREEPIIEQQETQEPAVQDQNTSTGVAPDQQTIEDSSGLVQEQQHPIGEVYSDHLPQTTSLASETQS